MGKGFRKHSPKPLRFLYHPVNYLISRQLGKKYNVQHSGLENYAGLENNPVIVLAKHQFYDDIPHEAQNVWRGMRRDVYFVMKYSLPIWMRWLAGVKTVRPKDIRELSAEFKKPKYDHLSVEDKKRRKEKIAARMKQTKEATDRFLVEALQASQVLVVHPETTRIPYEIGTIPDPMLDYLMDIQNRAGVGVSFVPLDFRYGNPKDDGSLVEVMARPPIMTASTSELEQHVAQHIELIGLKQRS